MAFTTDPSNPCNYLYTAISLCNKKDNFFINKDKKLEINDKNKSKRETDLKIVSTFMCLFDAEVVKIKKLNAECPQREKLVEILNEITIFIKKSKDIPATHSEAFNNCIHKYLEFFDNSLFISGLLAKRKKGEKLSFSEFHDLKTFVYEMSKERTIVLNIIIICFIESIKLILENSLKKLSFLSTVSRDNSGLIWNAKNLSIEECAICLRLESFLSNSISVGELELEKIYKSIGRTDFFVAWYFFFLDRKARALHDIFSRSFCIEIAKLKHKSFISLEVTNIAISILKEKPLSNELSLNDLNEMQAPIRAYNNRKDFIDETYKQAFSLLQDEVNTQGKVISPTDLLFDSSLLSPDQLSTICIPETTSTEFENQFLTLISNSLDQTSLITIPDLFKIVETSLFSKEGQSYVCFKNSFCRKIGSPIRRRSVAEQDFLTQKIAKLSLKDPDPLPSITTKIQSRTTQKGAAHGSKKKKKASAHSSAESMCIEQNKAPEEAQQTAPVLPVQMAASKPTITSFKQKKGSDEAPIVCHERVIDWLRNSPQALKQPHYANMSPEEKEEIQLLHSYPIIITKLMKKHSQEMTWKSDTTKKNNRLYTCPGTIERYGLAKKPIEGYFADCFDEITDNLYHHFFHKKLFSEIIKGYKSSSSHMTKIERRKIEACLSTTSQETIEDIDIQKNFVITKRPYSIEVDNTLKRIKYSIAFPEGISC